MQLACCGHRFARGQPRLPREHRHERRTRRPARAGRIVARARSEARERPSIDPPREAATHVATSAESAAPPSASATRADARTTVGRKAKPYDKARLAAAPRAAATRRALGRRLARRGRFARAACRTRARRWAEATLSAPPFRRTSPRTSRSASYARCARSFTAADGRAEDLRGLGERQPFLLHELEGDPLRLREARELALDARGELRGLHQVVGRGVGRDGLVASDGPSSSLAGGVCEHLATTAAKAVDEQAAGDRERPGHDLRAGARRSPARGASGGTSAGRRPPRGTARASGGRGTRTGGARARRRPPRTPRRRPRRTGPSRRPPGLAAPNPRARL